MNTIDRDGLKKESEEATFEYYTPSGKVVRELFAHELSGPNWRKYTREGVLKLIEEKAKNLGVEKDKHILLLTSSCKRAKSLEDMLKKMENFLLGGSQD